MSAPLRQLDASLGLTSNMVPFDADCMGRVNILVGLISLLVHLSSSLILRCHQYGRRNKSRTGESSHLTCVLK